MGNRQDRLFDQLGKETERARKIKQEKHMISIAEQDKKRAEEENLILQREVTKWKDSQLMSRMSELIDKNREEMKVAASQGHSNFPLIKCGSCPSSWNKHEFDIGTCLNFAQYIRQIQGLRVIHNHETGHGDDGPWAESHSTLSVSWN